MRWQPASHWLVSSPLAALHRHSGSGWKGSQEQRRWGATLCGDRPVRWMGCASTLGRSSPAPKMPRVRLYTALSPRLWREEGTGSAGGWGWCLWVVTVVCMGIFTALCLALTCSVSPVLDPVSAVSSEYARVPCYPYPATTALSVSALRGSAAGWSYSGISGSVSLLKSAHAEPPLLGGRPSRGRRLFIHVTSWPCFLLFPSTLPALLLSPLLFITHCPSLLSKFEVASVPPWWSLGVLPLSPPQVLPWPGHAPHLPPAPAVTWQIRVLCPKAWYSRGIFKCFM